MCQILQRALPFPYTTLFRSELDVRDLVEDGSRGRTLGDGERDDLRALAGDVPGGDDPRQRQLRHEADLDGARRGKIGDRKSTRLNSSHVATSYAVFCLKKKQ